MTRARDLAAFVSNADGDIKFDTDTLFIDSSTNRVGLGTNAPSVQLDIESTAPTIRLTDSDASGTPESEVSGAGGDITIKADRDNEKASSLIGFEVDGTERMRIDSDGNVGIGTSSPDTTLHVNSGTANNAATFTSTDAYALIKFEDNDTTTETTLGALDNDMVFRVGAAERARINSSGSLLVAKTAHGADVGAELRSTGYVSFTRDGATVFTVRRNGTESAHMNFIHDATEVGAIGTSGSALRMFSTATNYKGLAFEFKAITPTSNQGVDQDNSTDLGSATTRFDDVRATNGTIQTSDENDKQDIASLTSAEITAATAISKLFKTYKWKDKVADKGDNARTHTGVVAQQVQTAMADAGLDASKYAFWCSDTWWEKDVEVAAVEADEEKDIEAADAYTRTDTYDTQEEAPEGATERNRKGIRYPELLAFVGAATEQRLTNIESENTAIKSRLDALEE